MVNLPSTSDQVTPEDFSNLVSNIFMLMNDRFIFYLPNVSNAFNSMEASSELGTPLFTLLSI